MHTKKNSRTPRIGRTAKLVSLIAASLALAACQGIPVSGPVSEGLDSFDQATQQVVYRPDMPVPGANQEETVRGFLLAASSAADDYAVAREFLTTSYRKMWDPYMAVLVDEGERKFTQAGPEQAKLGLTGVATIDEAGEMTAINPATRTEFTFELVRERGEWRINSAPNGVILDKNTFRDVWVSYPLYFWSTNSELVADQRWFLNRPATTSQVVAQLADGPSEIFRGALTNSFAPGSTPSSEAALVEKGIAKIPVTKVFVEGSAEDQERAGLQVATTLNNINGVLGYEITVDQAQVVEGTVQPAQNYQDAALEMAAHTPEMIKDGEYGLLIGTDFQPRPSLSGHISAIAPTSIVSLNNAESILATNDDSVYIVNAEGSAQLFFSEDFVSPTNDLHGWTWTAHKTRPQEIEVFNLSGERFTIDAHWLQDRKLHALRVSADGARIAFVTDDEEALRVTVTGIVRNEVGAPLQINDASERPTFWATGNFIDMDWIDPQRVGVLTQADTAAPRLTTGGTGIMTEERPAMKGATSLRGGGRTGQALVLDEEGTVWAPQGSFGWQRQTTGVSLLAKHG